MTQNTEKKIHTKNIKLPYFNKNEINSFKESNYKNLIQDNKINKTTKDMIEDFSLGLDNLMIKNEFHRKDRQLFELRNRKYRRTLKKINKKIESKERLIDYNNSNNEKQKNIFIIEERDTYFEMNQLNHIPYLSMLKLSFCDINYNNEGNFINLKILELKFCNLTNKILKNISIIENLNQLSLKGNNLNEHLNPLYFCNLKKLEILDLSNNKIKSFFLKNKNYEKINYNEISKEENLNKSSFDSNKGNKTNEIFNKIGIKEVNNNINILITPEDHTIENNLNNKYLNSNLRNFFNILGDLFLIDLNLSHNFIHYFDFTNENFNKKYSKLKKLDFSYNSFYEEMGILSIKDIPSLNILNLSNNPLFLEDKFNNLEQEIMKQKNIKLIKDDKLIKFKKNLSKNDILNLFNNNSQINFKNYIIKKENFKNLSKIHQEIKNKIEKFIKKKENIFDEYNQKVTQKVDNKINIFLTHEENDLKNLLSRKNKLYQKINEVTKNKDSRNELELDKKLLKTKEQIIHNSNNAYKELRDILKNSLN